MKWSALPYEHLPVGSTDHGHAQSVLAISGFQLSRPCSEGLSHAFTHTSRIYPSISPSTTTNATIIRDSKHSTATKSCDLNRAQSNVQMKAGSLEIQILVGGRPLQEFGQRSQDIQMECFVLPRQLFARTFQVYVHDDATSFLDPYDLRSEITVTLDGRKIRHTKNCILSRDISEIEFRCMSTQNGGSVPFLFAGPDELCTMPSRMGQIQVTYRRFHKTHIAALPRHCWNPNTSLSVLADRGSTLAIGGETDVELESFTFLFNYLTREMLNSLSSGTRFGIEKNSDTSRWDHASALHQGADLYERTSRDAFWRKSAKL